MPRSVLSILCVVLASCYAGAPSPSIEEPATPIDSGDTATPVLPDDAWMAIDGTLQVGEDAVVTGGTLTATVSSRDPNTAELEPVCSTTTPVQPDVVTTTPPSEPIVEWDLTLSTSGCVGIPDTVILGVGPLPTSIWPAVEQAGGSVRQVRGLYARHGGETVVFGSAATTAMFEGRGTPHSLERVPPGLYHLESAFLLPL
jgi:hypothetical protein